MISFIVIGRNEGWKLKKCLQSIYKTIEYNNLEEHEVIYVDSNSTDDSIERAKKFNCNKIFKITGEFNAAIARNIGAANATGEWYFFLDGDMEINSEWHSIFLEHTKKGGKYLTGQLIDLYYDNSWQFLTEKPLISSTKLNKSDVTNGGAFVIQRCLWKEFGGMKPELEKSQDVDFCYRLARKGIFIFRTETPYARHHTIQYNFDNNFFSELKQYRKLMFRGVIMRRHLFNKAVFKRNVRINYSVFLFSPVVLMSIVFHPLIILIYLLTIMIRGARNYIRFRSAIKKNLVQMIMKYFFIDIVATAGFIFFFPRKPDIKYQVIRK